jgi:acetolactate synthase-1/2/3 large subunit
VLLLNNRSYAILNIELARVGVEAPGPIALSLLDLSNPNLSWADIARGMGLQASTVETVEALDSAFAEAMAHTGPSLIEVML